MSLAVNTLLGPYEILELLGTGGMSEVYRARDTRLDRDVAVKVLVPSAAAERPRLDRLLREARAVSRLNHPHICALHDVGHQDGMAFLVMELLEGTTLAHELAKGPFSVRRAIEVAIAIAEALDAAHSRGVVHRDLKPSNVMVTAVGLKLLDFGLAKLADSDGHLAGADTTVGMPLTEEGRVLGTYPYMSPEQVEGKPADARSDIFALGVVLYEMVTGKRPFRGDNRAALTAAILTENPPPASSASSVSPLVDRVIARCLEKKSDARWQTARDLASALRWTLDDRSDVLDTTIARHGPVTEQKPGRLLPVWPMTITAGTIVALVAFFAATRPIPSDTRIDSAAMVGAARPAVTPARIVLAVLPFRNLTGDPEQDYLCDGLTEEMIARLGSLNPSRLGVIARTSAMHYKQSTKRADEIGRELGASYLLETSLKKVGTRVRVTAQLVESRTQSHVWVEQYERDVRDILVLQRDVAEAVASRAISSLGIEVDTIRATANRHSTNSLAYEHYLRGRHHWVKDTSDDLKKAREHFQTAIDLDSSYARAYSGLADTYALLGSYDIMPLGKSHPLGRTAAMTALKIDDSLGEAHRSLAAILGDYYWLWNDVERHYRLAMELDPNDATTLRFYSFYLAYTGRPIDALPIAEKARGLDPVSPNARLNLGVVLNFAERFDDAISEFEETLDLDRSFSFAHAMLAVSYIGKGMTTRAVAEAARARAMSESRPDIVVVHAYTLARAGRKKEALKALEELHQMTSPRGPAPFGVALIYMALGDNESAFAWLDKAVEARSWELPILKSTWGYESLRADPRFPALIKRLGLPN